MSDYSIGAYKELYEGTGVSFEDIPAAATRTRTSSEDVVQEVFSAEVSKYFEFLILANHLFSLHKPASAQL